MLAVPYLAVGDRGGMPMVLDPHDKCDIPLNR